MNIITISREFGSGGRELGKRLADLLEYDYYDHEIIEALVKKTGLNEDYIKKSLENHVWQTIPLTFCRSFASINMVQQNQTKILVEQKCIIEEIAKAGKDCVIVGRNADVLLADYKPFRIFACATMDSKIHRCKERAGKNETLSRKEIENNIRRIDRNRAKTREMITGSRWGDCKSYHLVINTTDWNMKDLTPAVAGVISSWFRR